MVIISTIRVEAIFCISNSMLEYLEFVSGKKQFFQRRRFSDGHFYLLEFRQFYRPVTVPI